jgi:hypothetical protein
MRFLELPRTPTEKEGPARGYLQRKWLKFARGAQNLRVSLHNVQTRGEWRHLNCTVKSGDRIPGFRSGRQEGRKAGNELIGGRRGSPYSGFSVFLHS